MPRRQHVALGAPHQVVQRVEVDRHAHEPEGVPDGDVQLLDSLAGAGPVRAADAGGASRHHLRARAVILESAQFGGGEPGVAAHHPVLADQRDPPVEGGAGRVSQRVHVLPGAPEHGHEAGGAGELLNGFPAQVLAQPAAGDRHDRRHQQDDDDGGAEEQPAGETHAPRQAGPRNR